MVVGDVVSGLSAVNTILTFQPAAGVEVVITSYSADTAGIQIEVFDGALGSFMGITGFDNQNTVAMKIFVSNAIYIRIGAAGAGFSTSFTGIQTQ